MPLSFRLLAKEAARISSIRYTRRAVSSAVLSRKSLKIHRPSVLLQSHPSIAVSFRRCLSQFASEGAFHATADETLHAIQDTIEEVLEEFGIEFEISYASGVLTLNLPERGTWVINKQTPTQQLWWSSPISGPKRFEFNEKHGQWVLTKDETESITNLLADEVRQVYPQVAQFVIQV